MGHRADRRKGRPKTRFARAGSNRDLLFRIPYGTQPPAAPPDEKHNAQEFNKLVSPSPRPAFL